MINPAGKLKIKRKEAHLTQQRIADYLGVSRSGWANAEDGRKPLPLHCLAQIRERLKVAPDLAHEIARWHMWHYLPMELRPLLEDVLGSLEEQEVSIKRHQQTIHALHLRIRALESG